MPKNQPTAAKKARQAARRGEKFITALRAEQNPAAPGVAYAGLPLFEDTALPEDERLVLDGLRALAAESALLAVRMAEPDPEVVEALAQAQEKGVRPQRRRWASVKAAVDGYVLRESLYGPSRSGYTAARRGPSSCSGSGMDVLGGLRKGASTSRR
ncbi:hypothetical protein [Nonomuraea wenchangensis]|uniref:hypothetical protein n=1 Tax=Nonomuraea wenchangensis TaxID=568860 RepID=UPI0033E89C20